MQLLQWLLDLEIIRLDRDEPLALEWQTPWSMEAWMLICVALAIATTVVLVYRRERTTLPGRVCLAGVRCAIIALAVAVFCRPALVLQRDRVEPSFVALALDTSLSMSRRDKYQDAALARSVARGAGLDGIGSESHLTRFELVAAGLSQAGGEPLRTLLERNGIQLSTFSDRLTIRDFLERQTPGDPIIEAVNLTEPNGTSTDIGRALATILREAKGRRLAAITLVSDGAATHAGRLNEVLDEAAGRQIPIYPVRIGSPVAPLDIALQSVLIEQSVFINDRLPIRARLTAQGASAPVTVDVCLIDQRTDSVLDAKSVSLDANSPTVEVELHTTPTRRGLATYRVETVPLPLEITEENNSENVEVRVLDNELRVLYCEGYPRYEYRYLKNALLREPTIHLSVLLIEADERFVQEGSDPIRAFPESSEELNRFDVVIFGDVDPHGGWLSVAQMKMLLDFVGNAGGGFALIAGERAAPHRYLGTPLAKLLPVKIDPSFQGQYNTVLTKGFESRLTLEGRRSRVFTGGIDARTRQPIVMHGAARADLYWFARTLGPAPGASVLSEHPTIQSESGPMPIVVSGRYGAGRIFFQGTDDTWRRRRGSGEFAHDAYWVKVVRSLARGLRLSQARRLVLSTDRVTYAYASPVRTHAQVFDPPLLSEYDKTIDVTVEPAAGNAEVRGAQSAPASPRFLLHRLSADGNEFEGTWTPPRPGRFTLSVAGFSPSADESVPSVSLQVERPNLEAQSPQADHDLLQRLADATGGRVIDLDRLADAWATIPDKSVRVPDDVVESLWDSKLVFALFALMISMEWVLRKVIGLL